MDKGEASEVRLGDVISAEEVVRFRDLGLGRGVDVTNPNMWANKSPFILMHICPKISNLIGTEESGLRKYFTEEVSSLTSLQMNIKGSLTEPNSPVKIGINAENSRSKSSTRKTVGAKVHTRTITFKTDLYNLPTYSLGEKDGLGSIKSPFPQISKLVDQNIERQLYSRILDLIYADVQTRSLSKFSGDEVPNQTKFFKGETPVDRLSSYLETLERGSPQLKLIASHCTNIIKELSITHYVNAIELGAMAYKSFTLNEYDNKFGAGANIGADYIAEATISVKYEDRMSRKSTKRREIGKIPKETYRDITRDSSEEAVIGFQIQPIHKLVRLNYIQVCLQKAVKEYMDKKSDKSEGPFLISGKVDDTQVYWRVNQQYQLVCTTNVRRSSPFYVIPTEQECNFLVVYYSESKDARYQPRSLNDPMISISKQAPLPCYLTSNANIFGFSSQPLKLASNASTENAHFRLQDKLTPSSLLCSSTTLVRPENWIEGEEFFINCNRGAFRIAGYLAMKRDLQNEKSGRADSLYTTVIVPTKSTSVLGMLFRLLPVEYREAVFEQLKPEEEYEAAPEQLEAEGKFEQLEPKGEIPTEPGNKSDLKVK